ncbi:hypothetical protein ACSQ6I_05165 [Anabaena sp. WFMT]|uniref:hypothetical protein n=1 Tax=Anabaena sp. WFMT TaxID=3449730 RepID=UPI003F29196D
MLITGRRIRNLESRLRFVTPGETIVLGIANIDRFPVLLQKVGFTPALEVGESVLPSLGLGPKSRYNSLGKDMIHRDCPKETAYRMIEWRWKQWCGGGETEEVCDFRDVPYQRYPRTHIPAPSIELKIATNTQGEKILVSTPIVYDTSNHSLLLHIINLCLEIFRECQVFSENLDAIINVPLKRLNWTILKSGQYPWSKLRQEVKKIIENAPRGKHRIIEDRIETINKYVPDFFAVGRAGFSGYIVFGFSSQNLFVLESIQFGNATYILGDNWERLSLLSKAEILNDSLHQERIVHRIGWHSKIRTLLSM